MMRFTYLIGVVFVSMLHSGASATQDSRAYRAMCASELDLLRIETLTMSNPSFENNIGIAKDKYGIFPISIPFECELSAGTFKFELVSIENEKLGSIAFGLVQRDDEKLFSYLIGEERNHVFTINQYNASHCSYDYSGGAICVNNEHEKLPVLMEIDLGKAN